MSKFTKGGKMSIDALKSLRIYKSKTTPELLNSLLVTTSVRFDSIVDNSEHIYKLLCSTLGKTITHSLMVGTMGKQFTAGISEETLRSTLLKINGQGYGAMIDYLAELKPGVHVPESEFDYNCQKYMNSLYEAKLSDKNSIAIRATAMCDLDVLLKMNKIQNKLYKWFQSSLVQGETEFASVTKLRESLSVLHDFEFNDDDFNEIISTIKRSKVDSVKSTQKEETIHILEWKLGVGAWNVNFENLNENPIIKNITRYSPDELVKVKTYHKRTINILDAVLDNDLNFLAFDAEQSYLHSAVDNYVGQVAEKYRDRLALMNTFQNYLKEAAHNVDFEIMKKEILGIPLSVKLVRGAYMVEERKIAISPELCPIHDSLEDTHNTYNRNMSICIDHMNENGKLMVASHNAESVSIGMAKIDELQLNPEVKDKIIFAQLYGLGDHLSSTLLNRGFNTLRYVPFGEADIMLPYLIRRAQESKQMLSSVDLQQSLILHEMKSRIIGK